MNWEEDEESSNIHITLEDVACPICLDFPHNGVLLHCSSYSNGCRPFICDTDHTHSNCLARFKAASPCQTPPLCPLCRGVVTGWAIDMDARTLLNTKKRSCQQLHCPYMGTYAELQHHALTTHPHSCPSEVDSKRQLDWENFQQSADIIDVLSTIQAAVPHGIVLGDYVIEYAEEEDEEDEDYTEFDNHEAKWWTSCILFHVFGKMRCSGNNRRRSRGRNLAQSETSSSTVGTPVYRFRQEDRVAAFDHHVYRGGVSR